MRVDKLVLATRNEGKIAEIRALLDGFGIDLFTVGDFPNVPEIVEDGETFCENVRKKAGVVAKCTGYPALADDSGLEVDALSGAPGVRSARFAGERATHAENNRKLRLLMKDVPPQKRTARFRCTLALAFPDGTVQTVDGVCEGTIAEEPQGENGFGYDPLFFVPELGKTFAQISRAEKGALSHRGRALKQLKQLLGAK
ncbi:MAG: XTP/dITP diphosphatase [Candidatus Latescibacterota bacterium]